MKFRVAFFLLICLFIFMGGGAVFHAAKASAAIQEDIEIRKLMEQQRETMRDIATVVTALADYVIDNGSTPNQDGTFEENEEFINALSPFYVKNLPIYDAWGNPLMVYCGEACNGKYGISGCAQDDFIAVSYGRDGKKEGWEFDSSDPRAGLYEVESAADFDKDLIMWNGSWVRAPMPRRR